MSSYSKRWSQLPFKQRTGSVTGLVALGATMTGVTASTLMPIFWRGLMTGVWLSATLATVVWLVKINLHYRRNH